MYINFWIKSTKKQLKSGGAVASCLREVVGGKPVKTGGDVAATAKKRPEEALFAVFRQHDYRLRTCSQRPTAKPARPNYTYFCLDTKVPKNQGKKNAARPRTCFVAN